MIHRLVIRPGRDHEHRFEARVYRPDMGPFSNAPTYLIGYDPCECGARLVYDAADHPAPPIVVEPPPEPVVLPR